MKTKVESFDEIVFNGRNHEYGAYLLRKKQPKTILTALIIGFFVLSSLLAYPVIASYLNRGHIASSNYSVSVDIMRAPSSEPAPPPPPPPTLDKIAPIKFLAPTVVDEDIETTFGNQDELATVSNPSPISEVPDVAPTNAPEPVILTPPTPEIFTVVEEMPSFPGGNEALTDFLRSNLKYPEEAKELGIQGKVFVTFTVNEDGSIVNVSVLRGIGGNCDEEAIRVVNAMPKWIPGKQRGTAVKVQFNLPVKFTLQ